MPFTFSHPAIVFPLYQYAKKWTSLTGLVIGSITPDFEYFIRMDNKKIYTHTWSGLFLYDLPLGLILAFVFHNIVRNAFIRHSPAWLQRRLVPFMPFNWNNWFAKKWDIIVLSLFIGSITHLFWDSFTHEYGFVVETVPALRSREVILGFSVKNFFLLQLLSSLVGGLVVLYAIVTLPVYNTKNINKHISVYWIWMTLLTIMIYIIRRKVGVNTGYSDIVIPLISAFLLALILTPFVLRLRSGKAM